MKDYKMVILCVFVCLCVFLFKIILRSLFSQSKCVFVSLLLVNIFRNKFVSFAGHGKNTLVHSLVRDGLLAGGGRFGFQ